MRPIVALTAGIASLPLIVASGVTPIKGTISSPEDEVIGVPKVIPEGPPTTASAEIEIACGPTASTWLPGTMRLPGSARVGSRLVAKLAGWLAPVGGKASGASTSASIPGRPGPRAPTGAHARAATSAMATARCHGRTREVKDCWVMIDSLVSVISRSATLFRF